jgi:hypothetical protein
MMPRTVIIIPGVTARGLTESLMMKTTRIVARKMIIRGMSSMSMIKDVSSSVSLIGAPDSILKLKASILSFLIARLYTIFLKVTQRTYMLGQ